MALSGVLTHHSARDGASATAIVIRCREYAALVVTTPPRSRRRRCFAFYRGTPFWEHGAELRRAGLRPALLAGPAGGA